MTKITHETMPPDEDGTIVVVAGDGVESHWFPSQEAERRDRVNRALHALVAERLPLESPEALERLRLAGAEPELLVKLISDHDGQWPEVPSA